MIRALILGIALALAAAPAWAEQQAYFAALEDVPVAPGLAETDGGFSFSGGEGRIIEAHAAGAADPANVTAFYAASLPALGWALSPRLDGALVFQRGREQLQFSLASEGSNTLLTARLVASAAAMTAD